MGESQHGSPQSCEAGDSYSDPRAVVVYDALFGLGPDTDYYRRLAGTRPLDVLDVGCGTGRLSLVLAKDGHRVTAVDPSMSMLTEARRHAGSSNVSWILGDARALRTGRTFDLTIMAGHAFQCLLNDLDTRLFLAGAHSHLRPGGRIAFETRNPALQDWTSWTASCSRRTIYIEGMGQVEIYYEVVGHRGDLVTYQTVFRFGGAGELITTDRIRFPSREKVVAVLRDVGFDPIAVGGGWDGAPATPESSPLVFTATRS